ncbi:MAG: hypothetical protein Q4D65_10875 [Peptostreptococcaceae bacterium]|nr:hypothetical protein [Peptostreptococcaceae bacterium]
MNNLDFEIIDYHERKARKKRSCRIDESGRRWAINWLLGGYGFLMLRIAASGKLFASIVGGLCLVGIGILFAANNNFFDKKRKPQTRG